MCYEMKGPWEISHFLQYLIFHRSISGLFSLTQLKILEFFGAVGCSRDKCWNISPKVGWKYIQERTRRCQIIQDNREHSENAFSTIQTFQFFGLPTMNMYLILIKIRLLVDFWYLCLDKLWVGRRSLSYRRTIPISQTTLICLSNSVCIKYCLFICIPKHWYWCYVSSPNRTNRVHAICQVLYLWRRYNRDMIAVKNLSGAVFTDHSAQCILPKLTISHWPFFFHS